ncbi:MAG: M28 family peptidase [Gemmatimonadaceae bacterium]|nr:M28 family peptidase [Gemmatimonadaceae bacterium]
MRTVRLLLLFLIASNALSAQATLPLTHKPESTTAAITTRDLMTRLYMIADDSMKGRQAGSEGHQMTTAYIASELKKMGLQPAGDSGGYFQYVPLVRRHFEQSAALSAGTTALRPDSDFVPIIARGTPRSIDGAQTIYAGVFTDSSTWITADQARGKFIVFGAPSSSNGGRFFIINIRPSSRFAGAAGVAIPTLDIAPPDYLARIHKPGLALAGRATGPESASPLHLLITQSTARTLLGGKPLDSLTSGATGETIHGTVKFIEEPRATRNVIAVLPGSDPKVRGEYVAIGAHSDHIGTRDVPADHDSTRDANEQSWEMRGKSLDNADPSPQQLALVHVSVDSLHKMHAPRMDSVFNGADDDGSGTVAVLEIAQKFATERPRPLRSILFVWHTGEELGLLGSRWFTDHPTVPRDSIVTQLNIDMIGRGDKWDLTGGSADFLSLVGSRRLSTELGDLAESVNRKIVTVHPPLHFDYSLDRAGHPENIYCRSDHYMYARYGIPIIFFTTGLHQDYHQLTDEPEYIDYSHMQRIASYVHDLALTVANLDHRVVVDKPKPDPMGVCRQ